MMRKYLSILVLAIILFSSPFDVCQPNEDVHKNIDSTYRFQGIVPPIEFQHNFNEIFDKPLLSEIPDEVVFDTNPSTVWLRTELLISNTSEGFTNGEINTHFTSPLYQQYLNDSKFNMFRYVLGLAETGAVGYMAYKHIKKYGFWK